MSTYTEKDHRVYYQDIVYAVCNAIDGTKMFEKGTVCGTVEEPSNEVQERAKKLCDELAALREEQQASIAAAIEQEQVRERLCEELEDARRIAEKQSHLLAQSASTRKREKEDAEDRLSVAAQDLWRLTERVEELERKVADGIKFAADWIKLRDQRLFALEVKTGIKFLPFPDGRDPAVYATTDGQPPEPGRQYHGAPKPIDPKTGQHESYWILSEEERAKEFVRPLRLSYKHLECGTVTTMGLSIAETYARDPRFYGATFCCKCKAHFPVGEDGEFVWVDSCGNATDEKVGT